MNVPRAALQSYETGSPSGSEASARSRTSPPRGTVQGSQVACTVGGSLSRIVTSTDDGSPALTSGGSAPSDTVNVSSSTSASSTVAIAPAPVVCPPVIVMLASEPKSPGSAVPVSSTRGTVTSSVNASDSRALTVTDRPSSTGFGDADSLTVGGGGSSSSSRIVTSTNAGSPAVTSGGNAPSDTVNVSSSTSASSTVAIAPAPVVCPPVIVMLASDPKSSDSAVPVSSTSGIVTSSANASDSDAVTVTDSPSSTGFGDAARLTEGSVGGVNLVKVSHAMGTLENLPVPAMFVITPCGSVSSLFSENSVPSSVPASCG